MDQGNALTSPHFAPELTLVAPVFNEADSLPRLWSEIVEVLEREQITFEAVVVDDASSDDSLRILRALSEQDPRLRVIALHARRGQSAALAAGLRCARGRVIVTIDADLQNDPADIPLLLAKLEEFDVVSGIRRQRNDSWSRRLSSRAANAARRLILGDPFTDIGCSLKAYRAEVLRDLPFFDGMHRFLPVLATRRGGRATEVHVNHRPRYFGESKYGAVRGRLGRGMADLLGVRWLLARSIGRLPQVPMAEEVTDLQSVRASASATKSAG